MHIIMLPIRMWRQSACFWCAANTHKYSSSRVTVSLC